MAFDTTLLTDYSWADIAKAAKHAMMSAAVGGDTLTINGRTIDRISIAEAEALYKLAKRMMQAESADDNAAGIALLNFNEPT